MISQLLRAARGESADAAAEAHLHRAGLSTLARNWRAKGGELDLVMRDGERLVFMEVRARSSAHYGGAAASVTATKQRRLISAAKQFLMRHPEHAECEMRFDVLSFEPQGRMDWLQAAFDVENA